MSVNFPRDRRERAHARISCLFISHRSMGIPVIASDGGGGDGRAGGRETGGKQTSRRIPGCICITILFGQQSKLFFLTSGSL